MPKRIGHKQVKGKPRPTLVAWRKHRFPGKSQEFVAGIHRCDKATLSRWENGEQGVSDAAAQLLAKNYRTDTWSLFNVYPTDDNLQSLMAGATDEQRRAITEIAKTIINHGLTGKP